MIPPLPAEAYQLAEAHHLGTPRAVYKVHFTRSDLLISLRSRFSNIEELGTTIEHEFALHRKQYVPQ